MRLRVARLLPFVLTLAACTSVTRVQGPDGKSNWYDVHCDAAKYDCYQAAAEKCPHGYKVADSSGGAVGGGLTAHFQGDMLIQCKTVASEAQGQSQSQTPSAKDETQCDVVFDHIEDTADLWVEWFHGKPVANLPSREAWEHACVNLDDDVQLCLAAQYAQGHHDACLAKLQALPKETRDGLDGLLSK